MIDSYLVQLFPEEDLPGEIRRGRGEVRRGRGNLLPGWHPMGMDGPFTGSLGLRHTGGLSDGHRAFTGLLRASMGLSGLVVLDSAINYIIESRIRYDSWIEISRSAA